MLYEVEMCYKLLNKLSKAITFINTNKYVWDIDLIYSHSIDGTENELLLILPKYTRTC